MSDKKAKNGIAVKSLDETPSEKTSGAENLDLAIKGKIVEADPKGEACTVISSVDYPVAMVYRGKESMVSPRARLEFNDAAQVSQPLAKGLTLVKK